MSDVKYYLIMASNWCLGVILWYQKSYGIRILMESALFGKVSSFPVVCFHSLDTTLPKNELKTPKWVDIYGVNLYVYMKTCLYAMKILLAICLYNNKMKGYYLLWSEIYPYRISLLPVTTRAAQVGTVVCSWWWIQLIQIEHLASMWWHMSHGHGSIVHSWQSLIPG